MRLADAGFDLDAERAVGLLQVERRPVPGAQRALRLKRARCAPTNTLLRWQRIAIIAMVVAGFALGLAAGLLISR